MDTYAKDDAAALRDSAPALRNAASDSDGAVDGVDRAGELYQEPVAHGLDDAPSFCAHQRLDRLGAQRHDGGHGADLVEPHEAAVADDVGRKDGGELPLHAVGAQTPSKSAVEM